MTKNTTFAEKCQETVLEWLLLSAVKTFTDNFDNCSLGRYEIISWNVAFFPLTQNIEDRIWGKLLISHLYYNLLCIKLHWKSWASTKNDFVLDTIFTDVTHSKSWKLQTIKNTFKAFKTLFGAIMNLWISLIK